MNVRSKLVNVRSKALNVHPKALNIKLNVRKTKKSKVESINYKAKQCEGKKIRTKTGNPEILK